MFKKSFFAAMALGLLLCNIASVQAANDTGILPKASGAATQGCKAPAGSGMDDATYCGNYEINDFVSLGIKVSQYILGLVGSLSLLMFIYGGFMFLISAGSADSIGKAKKIIIAAVIGLCIVFASYLIIKTVLGAMGLNWNGGISSGNACNTNFGAQGYSCMNEANGNNCRSGYCPGDASIKCCKPN
jgi:hypothetical protein